MSRGGGCSPIGSVANALVRCGPEMVRHELHPLNLQPTFREPTAGGPQLALPIPVYDQPKDG